MSIGRPAFHSHGLTGSLITAYCFAIPWQVANYAHGMGTLDYAAHFRELVALAAANASSSAALSCTAGWDWSTNEVSARGSDPLGETAAPFVDLWCTSAIAMNKQVK